MTDVIPQHSVRKKVRQGILISPPNILKQKVGSGGISQEILHHAQKLLDENNVDFLPVAERYMDFLKDSISDAQYLLKEDPSLTIKNEEAIFAMLSPSMQLKSNGGMFQYPLITRLSDKIILFLEEIEHIDRDMLEIMQGYYSSLRLILSARIKNNGGATGDDLCHALDAACERYFQKYEITAQYS